jgi:NAD(P)H-hydrate epimerase
MGTGVSGELREPVRSLVNAINAHPAPVVSVDLPSGIDADTGQCQGAWVRAQRTITFGRLKAGLLVDPGADLAGVVTVVDIGLEAGVADDQFQAMGEMPDRTDLAHLWPSRERGARKRSSGHLLVVAGSVPMAGAAVLACRGALRVGAGLVTLVTPRGALARLGGLPPEVMVVPGAGGDVLSSMPDMDLSRFDGLLAGPGLGGGHTLEAEVQDWLSHMWELDGRPMLYDADALEAVTGVAAGPRVITPHAGEAARLLDCAPAFVLCNRVAAANMLAKLAVSVLKGPNSIVAGRRHRLQFNPTGNPVLATAGSGDVLAGAIAGLMVRGVEAWDAARMGVWVHGRAADLLAAERVDGWTAGDVAESLPRAISILLGSSE